MFSYGLKRGFPIALGYFPVSFTFGLLAVNMGFPPFFALWVSMTNLTSAGQFAGLQMMGAGASYPELASAMVVINLRYFLMSLTLSQKISTPIHPLKKALMAFGITDEIFAIAALEERELNFSAMIGLMTLPFCGWSLGTLAGALVGSLIPVSLQQAMGVALYGMFLSIFIPAAKKSRSVLFVVSAAAFLHVLLRQPLFPPLIRGGWGMILASVLASLAGAYFYPVDGKEASSLEG